MLVKNPQAASTQRKPSINFRHENVEEEEVNDVVTCLPKIFKGNFRIFLWEVMEPDRSVLRELRDRVYAVLSVLDWGTKKI